MQSPDKRLRSRPVVRMAELTDRAMDGRAGVLVGKGSDINRRNACLKAIIFIAR
jgi:hypothetical protein